MFHIYGEAKHDHIFHICILQIQIYFTPNIIFHGERKHRSEIEGLLYNNTKEVTRQFLDEVKQFDPEKPDQSILLLKKLTIETYY